jgi:hypothetical protein
MTPQSAFMILATVPDANVGKLKSLLGSMVGKPGMADPANPIVPFEKFEGLHYARFVILDDQTLGDFKAFNQEIPKFPVMLAFLGDCDGSTDDFIAELADRAEPGLRDIFSNCQGFTSSTNLLPWMKEHFQPAAANYVNWLGRTVQQVREEAKLRDALLKYLKGNPPSNNDDPQRIRADLLALVRTEQRAGRLPLTPPQPTPLGWRLCDLLHWAIVPAALVLLVVAIYHAPKLLIPLAAGLLIYLWLLRRYEKTEPEIIVRPDWTHDKALAALEDHDVTNQFTVLGSVKPSLFRRITLATILWLVDYGARHIYNRGHLGRIRTIHFARWVFLDDKRRVLFCSNYDGSLESYMDDFINKVGWGLNLVFSNGVGYPRTHWLVSHGSKDEQKFKYTLRRHELPTEVWYKAYPGLTAFDLARNARVRGIERASMTDDEARRWLRDL